MTDDEVKTETNNAPPMSDTDELQARRKAMLPSREAMFSELTRKEREAVAFEVMRLNLWPAEVADLAILAYSALDAAADMIRLYQEDRGIPAIPRDAYRLVAYEDLTALSMVVAARDARKAWSEYV